VLQTLMVWRAVWQDPRNVFTGGVLIRELLAIPASCRRDLQPGNPNWEWL